MGAFALNDLRVLDMKLYHQDMAEGHFLGVDILHQVHKAVAGCGEDRQAERDSLAVGGSHLAVGDSHLAVGDSHLAVVGDTHLAVEDSCWGSHLVAWDSHNQVVPPVAAVGIQR